MRGGERMGKNGKKIAREVRKWLVPVAKLLRAIADLVNAFNA